ncbi:MAG: c-type cytochrome [Polyangiaceae bacterium]
MRALRLLPWLPSLVAVAACSNPPDDVTPPGPTTPPDDQRPTVRAERPPPPLSGGTIAVVDAGKRAVVSDPDRDRVVLLSLTDSSVEHVVSLAQGSEPGRAVEDDAGVVHVVLRSADAVASIAIDTGAVVATTPVCAAPRGLAFERSAGLLHVACASGDLVSLAAGAGEQPVNGAFPIVRELHLGGDLRDVVVPDGDPVDGSARLFVSRMRTADVLVVSSDGSIKKTITPPNNYWEDSQIEHAPRVAWRLVSNGLNEHLLLHQMSRTTPVDLSEEGDNPQSDYGASNCGEELVQAAVTRIVSDAPHLEQAGLSDLSLAVDIAVTSDGARMAVLDARLGMVREFFGSHLGDVCQNNGDFVAAADDAVAIAYTDGTNGAPRLLLQTRNPSRVLAFEEGALVGEIALGGASTEDTGYDLFHDAQATSSSGLACASCHPEGRDDGHTWSFVDVGARRTPALNGTFAGTAPYHWDGELAAFSDLVDEVLTHRMGGWRESTERVQALQDWIEALAPIRPSGVVDEESVARGAALFDAEATGCSSCHSGPMLTNNETVDVGTGGAFQVPSLVGVGAHAPFMHDGCAATLDQRFEPSCGGDERHGKTAALTAEQRADLVAYLNTL